MTNINLNVKSQADAYRLGYQNALADINAAMHSTNLERFEPGVIGRVERWIADNRGSDMSELFESRIREFDAN